MKRWYSNLANLSGSRAGICLPVAFLVVLLAGVMAPTLVAASWIDLGGDPVSVRVVESDGQRSILEITIGGFAADEVDIDGLTYYQISLEGEGIAMEKGLPALPTIRRGVIIPDDREMAVTVLESDYIDYTGMPVAPSKGVISRQIDPATVPYTFDTFYAGGGIFPDDKVGADAPHIMRDFRGMVVAANAFQYLPASETLRVYTRMLIEVTPAGPGQINVLERTRPVEKLDPQFAELYRNHFINYETDRYDTVFEDGSLLIITYDAFLSYVQPLAEWKNQKGLPTQLVTLSETGSTYTQIKNYIQNAYDAGDLGYVLLIGDAAQVPTSSTTSDPEYSLVAGGDYYPDIFVGRFSAENPTQVVTQVERTISYERDLAAGTTWTQYGMGVASNQGPGHFGEYDNTHMDYIRDDLLGYGYISVDQIYDPSGTAAMVSNALNTGRGIINYCGHGSVTSWGSTGFSNSHVNALQNDGMLPYIISVACNNGTFDSSTCFAEAWLRATNGGQPTGAIACYMSMISQSWDPPMYAQDEAIDLLTTDQMRTIGGLWFNGSCHMIDAVGAQGATEFRNWTIFGDPSLCVRTKTAEAMTLTHNGALIIGQNAYEVTVPGCEGALCALYADGVLYGTAYTNAAGYASVAMAEPPLVPMTLTLTVTCYNKETAVGEIQVLPPEGPYLVFESVTVLDSDGDDDGVLDEGEQVGLDLMLENVGVDATTGVNAVMTSDDPYLVIDTGNVAFPGIPAGGYASCIEPFVVSVTGDVPDGHIVQLQVLVSSDQGSWDINLILPAQAPVLETVAVSVNDAGGGNANGGADAGETFLLNVELGNVGASAADAFTATLSSSDPNVIILDADGSCGGIPVAGAALVGTFNVELLPECPEPSNVMLELAIVGSNGYAADFEFELAVGGWFDDMEADRGWSVGFTGDTASAGIWERVDPIGTTYEGSPVQMEDDYTVDPGTDCYVTGNGSLGGAAGENDVDGGTTTLLTPVFNLTGATSASVSYYRWYTNDAGNNPGEDWWDVEVTSNGVDWVSLEHSQGSVPFWLQMSFELTDYIDLTDNVQIRFVAADEGGGSLVEAGVDDFLLQAVRPVTTSVEDDDARAPSRLALEANYPNPFNPKTNISFELPRTGRVEVAVFDIMGRKVATLLNEEMNAGRHEVAWLGRDGSGRQVASGLYFYRLITDEQVLTRKMTLLK